MSETFELRREAEAAKSLLLNIRDIIGDDEDAIAAAVEGETNLHEALGTAVERLAEIKAHHEAIEAVMGSLNKRSARLDAQAETIRAAIQAAMGAAGMKKLELPVATLTCKAVPPKAVIVNEADIPSKYWKAQDPKLDRKAVLDALKAKESVPGAELSNGGDTIQIRWE